MKFLYVATERQAAERAALALRSVGPDVAVSWAAGLGQARRWIDENRNASALIVEVESDTRSFEALIAHARGIGVKVPVIGIPLMGTSEVLLSVGAVADAVVQRNAAFLYELPQAVSRTLFLTKPPVQQISVPPLDEALQQQLRDTEAVAARAEQRAQEALDQLHAREASLQAAIEQERAIRVELERRLADAESARQEAEAAHRDADRRRVRDAATFAEDLSQRDMQLADATTLGQGLEEKLSLEQELAEAKRILRLADQLHATTRADAEARIKDIQEQTNARLSEAASVTSALQRELADTVVALRSLERASSAQQALAAKATLRETELNAALAQQRADADDLARQLADQKVARQLAEQQFAADRQAAAEQIVKQQAEFDAAFAQEVTRRQTLASELGESNLAQQNAIETLEATRQDLDARLAAAHDAHRQLEEQHASAMAAARAALHAAEERATKQHTDAAAAAHALETRLAESVANADRFRAQLSETALALTHAEQQAANDRQALAEETRRRQAEFDALLGREAADRKALEARFADEIAARQVAEQQAAAARQAAAEQLATQQAAFDSALAQEVTRRQTLASELAERDFAHRNAIQTLEATRHDLDVQLMAAAAAHRQLEEQRALADHFRAQLSETARALANAEQQGANDRQAWAEETQRRQAEFDAVLGREAADRQALEGQLADEKAALRVGDQQHAAAINQAAARLAEHQQQADMHAAEAASALSALQAKLVAQAAAAAEQVAQREAQFDTELAQEVARRQNVAAKLTAIEAARKTLEIKLAHTAGALAEEVTRREALASELAERDLSHQHAIQALEATRHDLDVQLMAAAAAHRQLEEQRASADHFRAQLSETARALTNAEQEAAADRQAAAEQVAKQQATFDSALAQEVTRRQALASEFAESNLAQQNAIRAIEATRQDLDLRLTAANDARRRLEEQHASAMAAGRAALHTAEERATKQHTEAAAAAQALETRLAESVANADRLRAQLSEAALALTNAEQQAASDRQAWAEETQRRQAEFDALLGREAGDRKALEARFADEIAARKVLEQQHASAINEAAARLAEYQQQADVRATQAASAISALQAKLVEQAAALRETERQANSDRYAAAEQAAQRQAKFDTELAEEAARRQNVAAKLTEAEAARKALDIKLADTAGQLADATAALAHEVASRQALETQLFEERGARQRAEAQYTADLATARDKFASYQQKSDSRLAEIQQQHAAAIASAAAMLAEHRRNAEAELADQRQRAGSQIAELQQQAEARLAEATANAAATLEASLQRAAAERQAAANRFAQQQAALEASLAQEIARREVLGRDHASERTRLQAMVAERDGQLQEQATRYRVANEAAAKAMADIEHRLQTAREVGQRDAHAITQFEQQVAALRNDLEALKRQRQELKTQADRVPGLQKLIDETQAEHRLRFDHSPIGMWRSRRDGAIVQANQALVSLLRYKTVDELLDVNFSTTVFESADELQWLVDRCLASRASETVETTWRRNDGVGIVVRLMAIATSSEAVDFVAMDITMLRALEEKLRNSQRMEAVARYASEVAVTCDKLLGQVNQQGQQWLTRIESDSARNQGARLLDDVTRAAGFLRQLTVYGKEQKNAPELVDVKQVLRDLGPVLKQVAGSHVELVLPKMPSPFNLDVEMERFERILVNVAAYGRERMPFGGRLMIEVSPVVVDRTFIERYPNVRPGAHVLLTVTEKKGAPESDWPMTVRNQASGANGSATPTPKPGVDLGALQALVSDCGGHLWIMAEPSGNMELRIHLPRRVLDDRTPAKKAGRGRWMSKLAGARN